MSSKSETKERKRILRIIGKIVNLASDGEYIYRGQPNIAHRTVTSTLYRVMEDAVKEQGGEIEGADWLDMNKVQEEELKSARRFDRILKDKDDNNTEILSRIQHYSGDTNLIDFTKDYLVALFFACNGGNDGADGSVFLIKVSDLKEKGIEMIIPVHPPNRVTAQKSVFLQSPQGIISADIIKLVQIPLELKHPILDYLEAYHDISLSNIYNDLHGYIRNRKAHGNVIMEFYLGLYYGYKGDNAKSPEEKRDAAEKAIKHYNKVIQMSPNAEAYNNRGNAKRQRGDAKKKLDDKSGAISDYKDSISDCDKAIALAPNDAAAYNNRGVVDLRLDDNKSAIKNLSIAIGLNPSLVEVYLNRGFAFANLKDFQQAFSDLENAKQLALQQNRQDMVNLVQKGIELVTEKMTKS